ncbi:F-type H+-transporting ATPase subunit delta [Lactobacillus colini]|uniref:ATP synthase subunit delta n=1 Tax=Lactobacillus colini TaxID=1819254 RepID=A0ABS4MEP5_9LACO|nr:F0F1 ATP synthase subunit delta [Lactobacillus colini]MBP2057842.1 F-type H+-transporting ATPase subunit delta [Lactobacillus colini]
MSLSREEIAARYSKALFAYAEDANELEEVHSEMNVLLQVVNENPDMLRLLADPILPKNEKESFLNTFSQSLSAESRNFLEFLLQYDRFAEFVVIVEAFDQLYNKYRNIAEGTVISAVKLGDEELQKISKAYAKKYGLNDLILTDEVDPNILGGVILRVEDRIIDGSIRTKLQQIREQLINN